MKAAQLSLGKQSHATAERRVEKARRIESVLTLRLGSLASKDVLEIGTGAGVIAAHLARASRSLLSVDVVDERVATGFDFCLVGSERLPCGSETFDVVVSNHVVEHVDDQLMHLREIRRVMRPSGVCYLAMPNRFALLEPHFRLPLLSWLPQRLRTPYVRVARRGRRYDVRPLTYGGLCVLAQRAALAVHDLSTEVAAQALRNRIGPRARNALRQMHAFFPSYVVLLTRSQS
ncbi:MAG: class I SAM-dependent methyltransferase [Dehalococcoidia bacterium]